MSAAVFPVVEAGHPLERGLEVFRAAMAGDPRLAGPRGECEVKALERPDGTWAVDRLYCFVPDAGARPGGSGGFGGALLHARGAEAPAVHAFPRDPRLPALADPAGPLRAGAQVLRYVPLRRLTFRDGALVGKFKRPSTLEGAYRRLAAAWRAARAGGAAFAVPRPAGLHPAHSVYLQAAAPGADAATLVDAASLERVMAAVGRVHREVHALDVAGAPRTDDAALARAVDRDLRWIGFMIPGATGRVARIAARVARRVPDPRHAPRAFCHGDFVVSQLLLDGERVTVLDFDLAAFGDPCRDVAMLEASLPFDVPYLGSAGAGELARARGAYLAAYEERAGAPLDRDRLAWHRTAAAIYHLAMRIRKGRADRAEAERSLDALEAMAGGL
jgi:aminoglycoside phosphotransferase (APT) family kinase protein